MDLENISFRGVSSSDLDTNIEGSLVMVVASLYIVMLLLEMYLVFVEGDIMISMGFVGIVEFYVLV